MRIPKLLIGFIWAGGLASACSHQNKRSVYLSDKNASDQADWSIHLPVIDTRLVIASALLIVVAPTRLADGSTAKSSGKLDVVMPESTTTDRTRIRDYIFETLLPASNSNRPADDASLFDHGLDSLRLMQLLVFVEEKIGIMLPDHEVTPERVETVDALMAWIETHK